MSQQINLFNPIFLKQKKYLSALTIVQALGAIFVGLMLFSVYAESQVSSMKADAASTAVQLQNARTQVAVAAAQLTPREKTKALEEEIRRVEAELSSQREVADVVRKGGLGNTKGYSEYFQAFSRQIPGGLWITGLQIEGAGAEIELRGRALKAELLPSYINRLKGEASMKGKSFANLEMRVPTVEIDGKDAKGVATMTRGPAGFVEFVLQTSIIEKTEDQNPLEAVRPAAITAVAPVAPAAPALAGAKVP